MLQDVFCLMLFVSCVNELRQLVFPPGSTPSWVANTLLQHPLLQFSTTLHGACVHPCVHVPSVRNCFGTARSVCCFRTTRHRCTSLPIDLHHGVWTAPSPSPRAQFNFQIRVLSPFALILISYFVSKCGLLLSCARVFVCPPDEYLHATGQLEKLTALGQICAILWSPKVHYSAHKSPSRPHVEPDESIATLVLFCTICSFPKSSHCLHHTYTGSRHGFLQILRIWIPAFMYLFIYLTSSTCLL